MIIDRSREFIISGINSTNDYASRTDPSYASRIANLAMGGRAASGISADDMFGNFGRNSAGYNSGNNNGGNQSYPNNQQWSDSGNISRYADIPSEPLWNDNIGGNGFYNTSGNGNSSYWEGKNSGGAAGAQGKFFKLLARKIKIYNIFRLEFV